MKLVLIEQKLIGLALVALLVAGGVFYSIKQAPGKSIPQEVALSERDTPVVVSATTPEPAFAVGEASITPLPTVEGAVQNGLEDETPGEDTSAVYFEYRDKARGLGLFVSDGSLEQYKQYDTPTLEAMGEEGDLTALHALGNRYALELDLEKSNATYRKAAMFGSVWATDHIGAMVLSYMHKGDNPAEQLVEGLAWFEISKRRGGENVSTRSQQRNIERNGVDLNTVDWAKVNAKADAIYQQLLAERAERGLGGFDNVILD